MESNKKAVLINASWGAWYPRGSARLERSLIYHGWNYDMKIWKDEIINDFFKKNFPYTIKAAAFMQAMLDGYTHILWMDCSQWVVRDPNKLMDIIDDEGGLFIKSGYNLAQTSADTDLSWAKVSRDEAEKMPELWSCIFGVNLETEQGRNFARHFIEAYHAGVFDTPREHSGRSQDPRFLHARQDQTAVSWAFHKSGYAKLREPREILHSYYPGEVETDEQIVRMRGM